jgi:hypothetical protein
VRRKHFPANAYELVGIELPLEIKILGGKVAYKDENFEYKRFILLNNLLN